MSGSSISSGILTNNEEDIPEIERIMKLKIKELSIQIIPLTTNKNVNNIRMFGQFFQLFIHPAILSPTLSHIAIQLNMENDEDIIIMEYGQYLTEKSDIINKNNKIISSCDNCSGSSKGPKKANNSNCLYWYINKDGLRITKISNIRNKNSKFITQIIALNHYGITLEEFNEKNKALLFGTLFECIDCNIENKITLKELCNNFIGKKWEAKNYNFAWKNCQHFAAEVINILKATRKKEYHKIRSVEKFILPNCIISA